MKNVNWCPRTIYLSSNKNMKNVNWCPLTLIKDIKTGNYIVLIALKIV